LALQALPYCPASASAAAVPAGGTLWTQVGRIGSEPPSCPKGQRTRFQNIRQSRRPKVVQLGEEMADTSWEGFKAIVVEQLGVESDQVKPEANFVEDLNADSLDLVELIMAFEEAYGMEIPDEDAEKIQTVGQAWDYIKDHLDLTN